MLFSECYSSSVELPQLPNTVSCHLDEDCTTVQCCVEVAALNRSLTVSTTIDTCNLEIKASIERLEQSVNFNDYKFGR